MASCKFCGEPLGTLTCGGVALPTSSPLVTNLVCFDCDDDPQSWFDGTPSRRARLKGKDHE